MEEILLNQGRENIKKLLRTHKTMWPYLKNCNTQYPQDSSRVGIKCDLSAKTARKILTKDLGMRDLKAGWVQYC